MAVKKKIVFSVSQSCTWHWFHSILLSLFHVIFSPSWTLPCLCVTLCPCVCPYCPVKLWADFTSWDQWCLPPKGLTLCFVLSKLKFKCHLCQPTKWSASSAALSVVFSIWFNYVATHAHTFLAPRFMLIGFKNTSTTMLWLTQSYK